MDKTTRIDRLKNLTIVLLFLSALLLLYHAVFFESESPFARFFSGETAQTSGTVADSLPSSKPSYLLVTGLDGTHTAAKYDGDAREKLLALFSASLGEALGSAEDAKAVSSAEWQNALGSAGVVFDYIYPQPLSVIAASLGTAAKDTVADVSARRLCLSVSEEGVRLYYINAADGSVCRCTTALSVSSLTAKLGDYHGGEAAFAFELGEEYAAIDPYFIFSGEDARLQALSSVNPLPESGEITKLFSLFGMNARISSGYFEKGGSFVYVEGAKSLRVDNRGSVLFSVTDRNGVAIAHSGELTTAQIVSACAGICNASIGSSAGIAELVLRSCETDATGGSVNVEFGYAVAGVPVTLPDGAPAATFKVSGDTIVRAELYFRKYVYTGDTITALPEKQAVAIAKTGGGEPLLTYDDRGDGVAASWIVR
ncbi:MAG: hypothetical protein ACOX66_06400 [Oscillospiraceae bacterium]|jgi:hypothetical protein